MIRKYKFLLVMLTTFGLTAGIMVGLVFMSWQTNQTYQNIEVNFISPRQALIFWKTEKPTIGYVKYGEKKSKLKNKEYQTSSNATEIHTVIIEKIPTDGFYIQLHTEAESSFLLWRQTQLIKYDYQNTENNVYHP